MILHNRLGFVAYEVPGGTSGGGAPTPPAPQPGAPGQGSEGQGDGFRSTYFPNVPDEHWGLIEPHLQNVNRHVTQMEQRYAPFKSYTPEAVQGLSEFANAFDRDPMGTWIQTARMLQDRGVLNPDLDVDHLEALINGRDIPEEPAPDFGSNGNGQQGSNDPVVQQLLERLDNLEQGRQQEQLTMQQRQQDAALQRQMDWMKAELSKGGIAEDAFTDERLLAAYIAHRGNVQAAVKSELDYRNATLKGLVNPNDPKPGQRQDLDLPRGAPATRQPSTKGQGRGMFKDVSAAAEQALRQANQ